MGWGMAHLERDVARRTAAVLVCAAAALAAAPSAWAVEGGGEALGLAVVQVAVDASGDIGWLALNQPLRGLPVDPVDEVGLCDTRGPRVVATDTLGSLAALRISDQTLSWTDRGDPRALAVESRRP